MLVVQGACNKFTKPVPVVFIQYIQQFQYFQSFTEFGFTKSTLLAKTKAGLPFSLNKIQTKRQPGTLSSLQIKHKKSENHYFLFLAKGSKATYF